MRINRWEPRWMGTKTPRIEGVILDVDAAQDAGDACFKDAIAYVNQLKGEGLAVRLVLRDSFFGREKLAERLGQLGFNVDEKDVYSNAYVLARELSRRDNRATVYVIGTDGLKDDLQREGCRVIENPEEIGFLADYVIVGDDPELNYDKLTQAFHCLDAGAKWALADPGLTASPLAAGFDAGALEAARPGPGVIAAAIQAMAGSKPDFQPGVPRPHGIIHAVKSVDIPPEKWAYIGQTGHFELAEKAGITVHADVKKPTLSIRQP